MKLPRIRNPLFAALLAVVSFVAFAEPSETTKTRETSSESIKGDGNREGFLVTNELMSNPSLGQDLAKVDSSGDSKFSDQEPVHRERNMRMLE